MKNSGHPIACGEKIMRSISSEDEFEDEIGSTAHSEAIEPVSRAMVRSSENWDILIEQISARIEEIVCRNDRCFQVLIMILAEIYTW
jgi:hypothetical protein